MERMDINTDSPLYARSADRPAETQVQAAAAPVKEEPPVQALTPEQNLLDALKLLGFKPAPENLRLAEKLLQNGMPVTDANLRGLNRAVKLAGDMDQAAFILRNTLPLNAKTAELVKGFASNEFKVLALIEDIVKIVQDLPEGDIKDRLIAVLAGEKPGNAQQTAPQPVAQEQMQPPVQNQTPIQGQTAVQDISTPVKDVQAEAATESMPKSAMEANAVKQAGAEKAQSQAENNKPEMPVNNLNAKPEAEHRENAAPRQSGSMPPNTENGGVQSKPTAFSIADSVEIVRQAINRSAESTVERAFLDSNAGKLISEAKPGQPQTAPQVEKPSLFTQVMERFAMDPEKDDRSDLNTRLSNLREAVAEAKLTLADGEGHERLGDTLNRLENCLDFFCDLKRMVYMQIPLWNGDEANDMGLYVFRDKGRKSGGGQGKQSALLSLDFAYIGHFEAYIQKIGQGVSIRFVTEDGIKSLVLSSVGELAERLASKGYRLDSYIFAESGEPFALTDSEPADDNGGIKPTKLVNLDLKA
ncbi:MAG: hypothetical protein FWE91_03650 [Defluviitaleaceae bacterium]|nr:hypothetical protein [Defluviitaleaceae bacterium]MCL2836002.1 hypothetical protein [Defluviitaleaceae bacterium]